MKKTGECSSTPRFSEVLNLVLMCHLTSQKYAKKTRILVLVRG